MAFDYTGMAACAKTLIGDFGRSVSFQKWPRAAANPSRPWEGPDETASTTLSVTAAFVNPSGVQELGFDSAEADSLVRNAEQVALVAGNDVSGDDLEDYDTLKDGSKTWKVQAIRRLQPGGTVLLYYAFLASKT